MGFVRNAVGAFTGSTAADAARQSSAQQQAAIGRGIGEITAGREQSLGFLAPFQQIGQQGIANAGFLTDPNTQFSFLQNNPLFKAALENANTQTQQQAAAGGRLSAGDTMQRLAQNILLAASPLIQNQKSSILDLLNIGTNVAGNQANIVTGASGNIADLYGSQGAAQAAGTVGAANARTSGFNNILQAGLTAGAIFSDRRLKDNIKFLKTMNGFDIYSWTWNIIATTLFRLKGPAFGVIAQEIEKTNPDAVSIDRGYLKVNYSKIGVPYAD